MERWVVKDNHRGRESPEGKRLFLFSVSSVSPWWILGVLVMVFAGGSVFAQEGSQQIKEIEQIQEMGKRYVPTGRLYLGEVRFEVIELDKPIKEYIGIAVKNDKDIQRIDLDIKKMSLEIEIAQGRAERIVDPPTLNINVGAGYSSSVEEKKDFGEGTTLSTGISASYNLWNIIEMIGGGGQIKEIKQIEGLNIELEKLKVEREKRVGEVETAVKKTYSALRNNIFKMEMRKEAAKEAKEEYEITKEAFERGAEEVERVRGDKEEYLSKLESFLDAVVSYQFQLAEWEKYVGRTE